jgi:hypothetical protein
MCACELKSDGGTKRRFSFRVDWMSVDGACMRDHLHHTRAGDWEGGVLAEECVPQVRGREDYFVESETRKPRPDHPT